MAGLLLFVILMYCFHKIQVQAHLSPKLTVYPPVITETDSVTLNCQTPPSVSVTYCHFYTLSERTVRVLSCLKTLTGTELLKMADQSSPAEVELKCYYIVMDPSPESNTSSIIIKSSLPPKLTVNPPVITETDSVTLNCQTPPSVSVSQCYFYTSSGGTVRIISCLQTLTGTELLQMTHQRSPAEVEVKCYYTVKIGGLNYPSPHSDTSSFIIQRLLPPKVKVSSLVITETDSVTLTCQTPPSVSVSQCYFYTLSGGTVKSLPCLQTLTGTELLQMAYQRSPAEVKVICFYTVNLGETNSQSPHSDSTSISIQSAAENNKRKTDLTSSISITKSPVGGGDKGLTVNSASTPVTPVKLASGQTVFKQSNTVGLISTSLTSVKITSVTAKTNPSTKGSVTTTVENPMTLAPGDNITGQVLNTPSNKTSLFLLTQLTPVSETWIWIWKLVAVVAGFGVTVGVILLGFALLCTQRRTEKVFYNRTQAKVTDDFVSIRNIDRGERELPASNAEAYSMITSEPGSDCPTGSEKPKGWELKNEDDTYHMYSTISEEPAASALKTVVYSTTQAH